MTGVAPSAIALPGEGRRYDSLALSGRPEFALYAALKLDLYARHEQGGGEGARGNGQALPVFTARHVHRAMAPRGRQRHAGAWRYTDFFDTSAYFVRERLRNLNHGTALEEIGRGMRNSVQYRWREPIDASTMHSFRSLAALMGRRLPLALDLYRLASAFRGGRATIQEVIDLFRIHRSRFVERKWYRISTSTQARSPEFTHLVLERIDWLVEGGFLESDDHGIRLTERGEQAVHWFELFVHSAAFQTGDHGAGVARQAVAAIVATAP